MTTFLFVISMIGSAAGGFVLLTTFGAAKSAPQEAAGAAIAIAFAVIPYVLARSVQLFSASTRHETNHRELVRAIEASTDRREDMASTRPAKDVERKNWS